MRHTHYVVHAFDGEREGIGGNMILDGLVTLDLIVENENNAISKAQKLVMTRNFYRIISVFEHDPDLEIATQISEPIIQQLKNGELTLDRIQILEATGEIKILPDLVGMGSTNGSRR